MVPLVSFLTSAYGTERYIGDTIASVLAQTRADWELIIVDNGNSDEMARIVGTYTADPRITLIRQPNKGMLGGVAAAAGAAVGRYLCTLDSDDQLLPDYCARIAAVTDMNPGVAAIGCDAELFWEPDNGRRLGYFESVGRRSAPDPSRPVSLEEMLDDGVPSYFGAFRRDVWDAHRAFDPCTHDVEPDVALWLSLASAGREIRVLPDKLARQRLRSDSLSHDSSSIDKFEARLEQSLSAAGDSRQLRRLRYNHAMRRGRTALLNGDIDGAKAAVREAYWQKRTLRAAAVAVALRFSPGLLQSIHPAKNRAQDALRQTASTGGAAR
jgi:glycosyltransferase involved in cell wall biosynthesis